MQHIFRFFAFTMAIIILHGFSSKNAAAQITLDWISTFTEPDTAQAGLPRTRDIKRLNDGRIVAVGEYRGIVDFNGDGITDLENRGGTDAFVTIFNQNGTLAWAHSIGGASASNPSPFFSSTDGIIKVENDQQDNIFILGHFTESADFDNDGIYDLNVSPPDSISSFVAKYDQQHNFLWAYKITDSSVRASDFILNATTNSLHIVGNINKDNHQSISIISISNDGNFEWESRVQSMENVENSFISTTELTLDSQGNIYVAGSFGGAFDFDGPGNLDPYTTPIGMFGYPVGNAFLSRFSKDGSFDWVQILQGDASSAINNLALTASNLLVIRAEFDRGSIEIVTQDSLYEVPDAGWRNMLLAGFSTAGELEWLNIPQHVGTNPLGININGNDLELTSSSSFLVAGYFADEIDLDFDGKPDIISTEGLLDTFIIRYSSEGVFQDALQFDEGNFWQITGEKDGQLYVSGNFDGSLDLDGQGGQPAVTTFTPNTFENYLASISLNNSLPVELTTFTVTARGNTANLTWTTASEINNAGFEIIHHRANAGALVRETILTSSFIPGAGTTTEPQTYTSQIENLTPGTHYFQLKQIDFDGTFTLSDEITLSIDLDEAYQLEKAYPNPFNPQSTFSLSVAQAQEVEIALYDLLGRRVQTIFKGPLDANTTHQFAIDGSELPSGTYLYRITGINFNINNQITLVK